MNQTIKIFGVLFFLATSILSAQQDPHHTFYRYNMNLVNPAYAGSAEATEFALGIRSQWAGVEGAPESQNAFFSTPVGKKLGLGVSVINDKTFIERQTWLAVDLSYYVQLNNETLLYFGVKGSANSYNANTNGLVTYGMGQDGSLMDYESRFTPNVGAGVYLKGTAYYLSLSAPKLLTPDRLQERNGNVYVGTDRMHAYFSGGYDFNLSNSVVLHAMGMIRYVDASPLSYEFTGLFDLGSRFTLGAGYRYNESISGMFVFNIGNGFHLGYAYESAWQKPIEGIDNGTHEVFMRFTL